MTALKSEFLQVLHERGYVHQTSDLAALDALAAAGPIAGYIGFDATADSLHVGHLVSIMLLRRMQQCGHRPIVLMGGGTTKVGDPSGRDASRQLLSEAQIDANIASIRGIFASYLSFEGATAARLVNNADWLDKLAYIAFLRDVGRHFTINRMLTFDSVQLRLQREQPLTFLEFNYMILQAYDFLELARRYDCRLQMGGSDQWGNIVNGVELGRRIDGRELLALTTPLLTTAGGQKMGKTAAGAVWLKRERLSAYDFWQYWRNSDDADVGRFLRLFTDLPLTEVARLEALGGAEINEAKKILATAVTALAHGAAAAAEAAETARRTFEAGESAEGLPTLAIEASRLRAGVALYELLREAGLAASNGEARRLIKGGGVKVNDRALDDDLAKLDAGALVDGRIKLSVGKKRHALVRAA